MFINTGKRFQSCLSYKLKEIRWVSTKSKKEKQKKAVKEKEKKEPTKKYTDTINLPKTKFPVWVRPAQRSEVDEFIQKVANFSELYSWQREHLKNNEEYVLHDGPPYANGLPHMGHAINKILKDITIRSKLLQGYKINYRPGWDCHGLPIELLAVSNLDQTSNNLSQIDIREKARKFANEAISNQRAVFQSWGIMADWSNDGCYFTFDKDYIKNELIQFYNLYEKGLIYRDFKPVYWSPSSKTALAEAELEYNADHKSTSVTLAVKLQNNDLVKQYNNGDLYALLWTTTPWTLPANQAVAFNPLLEYSIIKISGLNNYYILATKLIEDFSKLINKSVDIIKPIPVKELSQLKYQHPLNQKNEFLPILPSGHVTADKGTGLVHTACAHGQDDFIVGKKNGFKIESIVDEEGKYVESIGSELAGIDVLSKECTYKVLSLINKDCILNVSEFKHSYPYDWRTKKPVILRASQQWFIDTDEIKQNALDALKDVTIVPEKSSSSFLSLLERRPYWCISRQRSWGVPIPVLYNKLDGTPLISRALIDHYCTLLDNHGPNFWWELPASQILPENIRQEFNLSADNIEKGLDILDIWLDSGLSWSHVLGEDKVADMYLEGVDQFTGWFQSSLMTSVALQGRPPYKTVFVHGFAVDSNGHKMSKSLGNVINPQEIVNGGNNKIKDKPYGVDVLRWWVAGHATQHANVPVSKSLLDDSQQCVQKIRSVLRFLLGAIHDAHVDNVGNHIQLYTIDKYMLHLLYLFQKQADNLYNSHQYNRICAMIVNFITNEVSAGYLPITKDRLYCDHVDSNGRRAVQSTMNHVLNTVLHVIAPVVPVLAEEVYLYHPFKKEEETLFQTSFNVCQESWVEPKVEEVIRQAFTIKGAVVKEVPMNSNNLNMSAVVSAEPELYKLLKVLQNDETSSNSELVELLQISSVTLREDHNLIKNHTCNHEHHDHCHDHSHEHAHEYEFCVNIKPVSGTLCERCRRNLATLQDNDSELCNRCHDVLSPTLSRSNVSP